MAEPDDKAWLTTGEVAVRLGYSPDQIRIMCENGRFDGDPANGIPGAYRLCVGAHWRVPRAAVDHFLSGLRSTVRRRSILPQRKFMSSRTKTSEPSRLLQDGPCALRSGLPDRFV